MKEQSAPQRREATTSVKLVTADVLLSRKKEIQNVIARRAYELFKGHGSINGHDMDDWIEAEVEVVRTYRHDLRESAEAIVFKAELPCSFYMVNGGRELDVIHGVTRLRTWRREHNESSQWRSCP